MILNCIIVRLLIYTVWVMPLRIAFVDDSATIWMIFDWILNAIFIADIFVNSISAYFDDDMNLVVSHKVNLDHDHILCNGLIQKILKNYLLGWFLLDLCSVIPFDIIFGVQTSYQTLLRIARLTRFYKLLKMTKYQVLSSHSSNIT